MPVLSYVYQLFSAEQCHAYIHTLRWKDRSLECPRCQSHDVGPWGVYHYRPGLHRYWCKGCRRTFNDLTHTLLAQTKRSLVHWIVATFLLCLACSSRRIARELGVHIQTSYRWCWWLRIRPCPMKWSANWQELLKLMNCITQLVVRGRPNRGEKASRPSSPWSPQETRAGPGPL